MNHIRVLFFATLRDRAGTKSTEMDIPTGITVLDFKELIVEKYPALSGTMDSVVLSVNREFAFDENTIPENAEIAMFPPVSGG